MNKEELRILRALVDTYEEIQGVRKAANNRLDAIERGTDIKEPIAVILNQSLSSLKDMEQTISKEVGKIVGELPIWQEFFSHIKGIGPTLAGKTLALNLDPDRNLSSWNAYFALTTHYWEGECEGSGERKHRRFYAKQPLRCEAQEWNKQKKEMERCGLGILHAEHVENKAPKKRRGYQKFWNDRARVLVEIIAASFLKGGKYYKEQYYHYRAREKMNRPNLSDGQHHNSARRKVVQLFLAHLYQAMHDLRGTEARIPYQFEYLKHSMNSFVSWQEIVQYESAKEKIKA